MAKHNNRENMMFGTIAHAEYMASMAYLTWKGTPYGAIIDCDQCGMTGRYYGECHACEGKGRQTESDRWGNYLYWSWEVYNRQQEREFNRWWQRQRGVDLKVNRTPEGRNLTGVRPPPSGDGTGHGRDARGRSAVVRPARH